jgi:hypothetical protein
MPDKVLVDIGVDSIERRATLSQHIQRRGHVGTGQKQHDVAAWSQRALDPHEQRIILVH